MDTRREFLKNVGLLTGGAGLLNMLPPAIAKALAIDPALGSTYLDAEHIVFLMQENRSFDHAYGSLQGVRGFNDPRAIQLPDKNKVWMQTNNAGETYCPFRLNIKDTKATWMSSLPHGWSDQVDARNEGRYDKWLQAKAPGRREYKGMPLTLGYHTREDIPFYYAMADAFTVCDHNFCSSLTGTTPNRLYFWSGAIRATNDPNAQANVWNSDADYDTMVSWKTFPERLEENDISWKVYQNELSVGVGFEGEEDSWLANFGDNPLEYFTQYQVKYHKAYFDHLPKAISNLQTEIGKLEQKVPTLAAGGEEATKAGKRLSYLKHKLEEFQADQQKYTAANYEALSAKEKAIHEKAFSTNKNDPDYHRLSELKYTDGTSERTMKAPKGDVLSELRNDVKNGKLPTVSWIVAPENFSDHPSSAWFGVWYISEVLDILTKNPEVWKKTIFVLTYDENDGYYDHLPPFVAPNPANKATGVTSAGIDTAVEYVTGKAQQSSDPEDVRDSAIGLGYRVPMVIASPWSRGGWVNSQVFDHTSSLQFLEHFLSHKTGKKIEETNISKWRRTVCGDLTSAFRPYNGEAIKLPTFLERDAFIEGIHKAQFKGLPDNFRKLSKEEIEGINKDQYAVPAMAQQEKGIRDACSLPYQLYADAVRSTDKKEMEVTLRAGDGVFNERSAGSPFHVYAYGYQQQALQARSYAVEKGAELKDSWALHDFEKEQYLLRVYGPNGFFREIAGSQHDPLLEVACTYETDLKRLDLLTGGIRLKLRNTGKTTLTIEIIDNAYKKTALQRKVKPTGKLPTLEYITTVKSFGWYDFSIRIKEYPLFERRFAGRVEDGKQGKTDPFMGRVV